MCETVRRNFSVRRIGSSRSNRSTPATQTPTRIVTGPGLIARQIAGSLFIELDQSVMPQGSQTIPIDTSNVQEIIGPAEQTEAAEADEWDREENTFNRSIRLTVQTRTVYDASGAKALYAFVRDLAFDRAGKLASISAERRVTVTTTESC